MALFSQAGSILKRTISQNSAPSMLNSVRYMSNKLFVGGISYSTDEKSLEDAFSSYGVVTSARIIVDRDTGRSRGFGFVDFADDESAKNALAMDGKLLLMLVSYAFNLRDLHGRTIRVNFADAKPSAPRGGGYGSTGGYQSGGGGGGYGGGSGGGGYQRNSSYGGGNDEF